MSMKLIPTLSILLAAIVALWFFLPWNAILLWANTEQRTFQNTTAREARAIGMSYFDAGAADDL
jgi:hypothetical protein